MTLVPLEVEHVIGTIVYLKTDPDQLPRMVTGYVVRPTSVSYFLSHSAYESSHYGLEITKEKIFSLAQ